MPTDHEAQIRARLIKATGQVRQVSSKVFVANTSADQRPAPVTDFAWALGEIERLRELLAEGDELLWRFSAPIVLPDENSDPNWRPLSVREHRRKVRRELK